MGHEPGHPKAGPHWWPVLAMGVIVATQVMLLQVALNRLSWGLYRSVMAPTVFCAGLAVVAWLVYGALDRDMV